MTKRNITLQQTQKSELENRNTRSVEQKAPSAERLVDTKIETNVIRWQGTRPISTGKRAEDIGYKSGRAKFIGKKRGRAKFIGYKNGRAKFIGKKTGWSKFIGEKRGWAQEWRMRSRSTLLGVHGAVHLSKQVEATSKELGFHDGPILEMLHGE